MSKLTPKQSRFIDEYMVDLNATQAAIRAGYSKKTAGQIAEQNLKKLQIQNEIIRRGAELAQKTQTSTEWVIENLVKVFEAAFAEEEYGHANKALELIGKRHGAFVDKVEHSGPMQINIITPDRHE